MTYVQMSISEAGPDTIACFDVNRWQPRPLIDLTIHSRFTPETGELGFEA